MVTRREGIAAEGILLALLGFAISRFVVAESLQIDGAVSFLAVGLIPLMLGLGLSVSGVILAVGTFRRPYVRMVTLWSLAGTTAMVFVLLLTAADMGLRGETMGVSFGSGVFVANVLLGGMIGGAITGDRVTANRRSRKEIARQADRSTMINRILRHHVLNKATIVQGYASLLEERHDQRAVEAIQNSTDKIESTIEEVGDIADDSVTDLGRVDLSAVVEETADKYEPGAVNTAMPAEVMVYADNRLSTVVEELVDNAIEHGTADDAWFRRITVDVTVNESTVSLQVEDDGPGVPDRDRKLLESAQIAEYDDPMSGFGLQTVRLLVEHYDGDISVTVDDGTTVTVTLLGATESGDPVSPYGVCWENVLVASGVAVVAATAMGLYFQESTGLLPVIGALYEVESPVVGWVSHQFHSIVFGLLFAAGINQPRFSEYETLKKYVLLGVGWGLFLGVFAAGFVMPAWLSLTGFEELSFPYFSIPGVIGHVIWGSVLGGLYHRFSE